MIESASAIRLSNKLRQPERANQELVEHLSGSSPYLAASIRAYDLWPRGLRSASEISPNKSCFITFNRG